MSPSLRSWLLPSGASISHICQNTSNKKFGDNIPHARNWKEEGIINVISPSYPHRGSLNIENATAWALICQSLGTLQNQKSSS